MMTDEPIPIVRVSLESASRLAAATGAAGALNTAVASFLLGDPFHLGVGEVAAELTRVRDAGLSAVRAAQVASAAEDGIDLDLVAEAAGETVDGALWLALRWLEGVRRLGLEPSAEAEVERLQGAVEAIAPLLSGAERC